MLDKKLLKIGHVVKIDDMYGIIMPNTCASDENLIISYFYSEINGTLSRFVDLIPEIQKRIEKIFAIRNHMYGSLQNPKFLNELVNDAILGDVYKIYDKPNPHKIIIDDKEIEISEESYNQLKNSLK